MSKRPRQPFGGYAGGGRGFNGGGASGSWETHADVVERRRRELRAGLPKGKGWRDITENGHTWTLDESGTARVIIGKIELGTTPPRSRTLQRQAGGPERRPSDDGGHYVAPRFNAPTKRFNLLPQDMNLNRGRWRALEDEWARDRRANKEVDYMIVPAFERSSRRPSHINVWWWVDGEERSLRFPNEPLERSRDKR
ncbi:MAG TPA: DNA/RNA non-specific endonuclease [Croceibacterium sp.]|nr:DNA/RNA non-specific endonuclease [Croceibacterium sp.]